MSFERKILLLVVVLLFIYIIFTLLRNRQLILNKIESDKTNKEGFSQNDPDYNAVNAEVTSVAIDARQFPTGISSTRNSSFNLPLKQFCIKGSINSAYSGNYISDIMVKYVLSRGCRFLDFEIYYINNDACVGFSSDPAAVTPTISNTNPVRFVDLLKTTLSSAFTSQSGQTYTTTNTSDPLFINLRLKTAEADRMNLFNSVQSALKTVYSSGYSNYFYESKTNKYVTGDTLLKDVFGKVIFIFENNSVTPTPFSLSNNSSPTSGKFYNMISNSDTISKSFYGQLDPSRFIARPPKVASPNTVKFSNDSKFTMVVPDNNMTKQPNPNLFSSIQNYGNQVTLFEYYVTDAQLVEYENLFKTYNTAFIPMAYCLNYINNYALPKDIQPGTNTVFANLF